jgi:hypothetical protein
MIGAVADRSVMVLVAVVPGHQPIEKPFQIALGS